MTANFLYFYFTKPATKLTTLSKEIFNNICLKVGEHEQLTLHRQNNKYSADLFFFFTKTFVSDI